MPEVHQVMYDVANPADVITHDITHAVWNTSRKQGHDREPTVDGNAQLRIVWLRGHPEQAVDLAIQEIRAGSAASPVGPTSVQEDVERGDVGGVVNRAEDLRDR